MIRSIKTLMYCIVGALAVMTWFCGQAVAQVPELHCTAVTEASVPVALYTLPNGQGHSFTEAQPFGGYPNVDATITLTILDSAEEPIANYPQSDIWLESTSGGLMLPCVAGTTADANTDENGRTTFQEPLLAAGANEPYDDLLMVVISGMPINQPGLEIFINSPDINGDGDVALADVAIFAAVYLDPADHPFLADFWWDGVVNIQDLVLFAQGYGAACP